MDINWHSALMASLCLVPSLEVIYTPAKFFSYSRKFYPLEYSATHSDLSAGFCVQKDMLHLIDPVLLEKISSPEQIVYANDVFFIACVTPPPSERWVYSEEARFHEFMRARSSALLGVSGRNTTPYWRVDKGTADFKVLIVGATNMGNIGDDLIAMSLGGCLRNAKPDCSLYFSDFRVSRADLADFDMVVVGGGGIVYASQFGLNETDNLSNYFKIPLWAEELAIPCLVIGVGIQGRKTQFTLDQRVNAFLSKSLDAASEIVVRDRLSHEVLAPMTSTAITVMPDLVFNFAAQFPHYKAHFDRGSARSIAFAGELFSERLSFFSNVLMGTTEDLIGTLGTTDFRYFVMSNDDLRHKDMFVELLGWKGIECKVHDLRAASLVDILTIFRGTAGLVTTRFHGLVLSIIAGCPALSVDLSTGKHAMLVKDYFPSITRNLINEKCDDSSIAEKFRLLGEMPQSLLPEVAEVDVVAADASRYGEVLARWLTSATAE